MKQQLEFGIRNILKQYHDIMMILLEEYKQTQREAAKELGISLSYFHQILRMKCLPNFHGDRGRILKASFEKWAGNEIRAEDMFPEAFFTKEFLARPKTFVKSVPLRLLMKGGDYRQALPQAQFAIGSQNSPQRNGEIKKRQKRRKFRSSFGTKLA